MQLIGRFANCIRVLQRVTFTGSRQLHITITLLFAIDGVIALCYIRETKVVVFALCTYRS